MYTFLLYLHSWGRWLVLLGALWVLFRSFGGWRNQRVFRAADNRAAVFFIAMLHLQVLVGLVLYFIYSPVSPVSPVGVTDFGASMKDRALRFWAVEHLTTMLIAAVVAQVGRTRSKKATSDRLKHRRLFVFTLVALVLMLLIIPWGGFNPYRPLFRL